MTKERVEFGCKRSTCACKLCRACCKKMPGALIPSDLARLIPPDTDPFAWARSHLLAKPNGGLVLAAKADGSCHFLTSDERCSIWDKSPFGCAFFRCAPGQSDKEAARLTQLGAMAIQADHDAKGIYHQIWTMLWSEGYRRSAADAQKARLELNWLHRKLEQRKEKEKAKAKRAREKAKK